MLIVEFKFDPASSESKNALTELIATLIDFRDGVDTVLRIIPKGESKS